MQQKSSSKKPLVIITGRLPLAKDSKLWNEFEAIAHIQICPLKSLLRKPKLLKEVSALITLLSDDLSAKVLKKMPNLQVIANYAVGFNNVDVVTAAQRGIAVCNTPDVLTNATAELTIGLLFAAARRFKEGAAMIQKSKFRGWSPELLLGTELRGSVLGIVGYGRIGHAVAEKARAIGMHVHYTSRHSDRDSVPLEQLLATSDFISIHCPLTAQTRHLFNKSTFSRMKTGAILVNTARGEIIDETSLLWALNRKEGLGAAALDVFTGEPKLNAKLRAHPKVFVLPHLGSATHTTRTAMAEVAIRSVIEVLSGRTPATRVN